MLGLALLFCTLPALTFAQPPFRQYNSFEYDADTRLPPDWEQPGDFITGRLMYPSGRGGGGRRRGGGSGWEQGGTSWSVDYPDGDRIFARTLRRFTTLDVRSVEQAVNPDDAEAMGYFPFLVVGLAGYWQLSDEQAKNIRTYLLKGGFLFADSFFGSDSWPGFVEGLKRIFPEYSIVDVEGSHPVFHTVYDIPPLNQTQIPNMNSLLRGGGGWMSDGKDPHWRGIFDEHGRLLVLIAFNNDVWDSLQWADDPRYPAERANLGLRLSVNIAVYALTH
jgi:hypothetical protein